MVKMIRHAWFIGCVLVGALPVVLAGEIHKWQDSEGRWHFGDRAPADVASELVKVRPNVYKSPQVEPLAQDFDATPTVVMYGASWCGYCKRARRYFAAHGIAYTEYDVETSEKGQADYQKLGAQGVPVILVGRQRLNGFSEEAFAALYAGG